MHEGREPGMYDSWRKAKYQVNGVAGSCNKRFSTLYEAIDSFTEYRTFINQITKREVRNSTTSQPNIISDEEVDRVVDEFISI